MNTEDLFKAMVTITNAHGALIRAADAVYINEDEDSFLTAERKATMEQSDPGDQRIAERHTEPRLMLTLLEPQSGEPGNPGELQNNHELLDLLKDAYEVADLAWKESKTDRLAGLAFNLKYRLRAAHDHFGGSDLGEEAAA